MKIEFQSKVTGTFREQIRTEVDRHFWSRTLRLLVQEYGPVIFDKDFERWLLQQYGISCLHDNAEYPGHLTGVELSDSSYTLLLLKLPYAD